MSAVTRQAVQLAGRRLAGVDRFVPHQADTRITAAVGLTSRSTQIGGCRTSSTSATPVPPPSPRPGPGIRGRHPPARHRICTSAFGAGLTWGATTVTWPDLKPAAHPHLVPQQLVKAYERGLLHPEG
ncbi:hypothetical protein AB5J52_00490 [Streptomyces sp. R39]|uniref:Uncharacterized protein n=1 Tax=Streptomyces sp. R39 TaxID=3238631 RepID=A0AB39QDL2_9ACTN